MFQREWHREGLTSSSFLPPGETVAALESANDFSDRTLWADFAHVSYEPVRIDPSHDVILMPIDPYRVWAGIQIQYDDTRPGGIPGARITDPVLRIMDMTGAMLRGERDPESAPDYTFDIRVGNAASWYIPLWSSHRFLTARLGWFQGERFVVLARSNTIRTPSGRARRSVGHFLRRDRAGTVVAFPPPYPSGYLGEEGRSFGGKAPFVGYGSENRPGSIPSFYGPSRN